MYYRNVVGRRGIVSSHPGKVGKGEEGDFREPSHSLSFHVAPIHLPAGPRQRHLCLISLPRTPDLICCHILLTRRDLKVTSI